MSFNTADAVNIATALAKIGLMYIEKKAQKKVETLTTAEALDFIDKAIQDFEELEIPEAFGLPDDDTEGSPV